MRVVKVQELRKSYEEEMAEKESVSEMREEEKRKGDVVRKELAMLESKMEEERLLAVNTQGHESDSIEVGEGAVVRERVLSDAGMETEDGVEQASKIPRLTTEVVSVQEKQLPQVEGFSQEGGGSSPVNPGKQGGGGMKIVKTWSDLAAANMGKPRQARVGGSQALPGKPQGGGEGHGSAPPGLQGGPPLDLSQSQGQGGGAHQGAQQSQGAEGGESQGDLSPAFPPNLPVERPAGEGREKSQENECLASSWGLNSQLQS